MFQIKAKVMSGNGICINNMNASSGFGYKAGNGKRVALVCPSNRILKRIWMIMERFFIFCHCNHSIASCPIMSSNKLCLRATLTRACRG